MKLPIAILLLYCTIFFSAIQAPAQALCEELPLPREGVTLHLDRNVYLAGETIWFKAWCFLNGRLEQAMSKVLYVEIFDETQKVIVQEKYLLSNNKTAGSIIIPEDVPSKYYFLRAYTLYMRNFSSAYFHYQQITIVNPFIKKGSIEVKANDPGQSQENTPAQQYVSHAAENLLQIELNKNKYQPRQQIEFQINSLKPVAVDLSIAVRLKGLGNQPAPKVMLQNEWLLASCQEDPFCRQSYLIESPSDNPSNPQEQKNALSLDAKHLQWLPETRGLTISGLLQNDKEENVAGALTMVAVLQEEPMLYMGTTDKQGAFTISLQHMQHQKNLFVGTSDEKNNVLIRNDFDSNFPEITTVPLEFDSTLHSLLESLNLHQQLYRIYPKNKTQPVFQIDQPNIASTNILEPDRRFILAEFIKVSTMPEVFKELTSGISLRKKEDKDELTVFNPEQEKWSDSPLILLDNVPVFNIAELLKIDPAKIEAIEIFHSGYVLGDYTIEAIISIISKTDNFAGYQWGKQVAFTTFKSFSTPQLFKQVVHLEKSHYPDFRPVLYWQPNLQLKQQMVSEPISTFAPDRPGEYEILVQGFTKQGAACMGYVTFEVVQE